MSTTKKYKAVLRYGGADFFSADTIVLLTPKQRRYGDENAYYVFPATPEAYDAQAEAITKALGWPQSGDAIKALAAIGIRRTAK